MSTWRLFDYEGCEKLSSDSRRHFKADNIFFIYILQRPMYFDTDGRVETEDREAILVSIFSACFDRTCGLVAVLQVDLVTDGRLVHPHERELDAQNIRSHVVLDFVDITFCKSK